jgi:hypothetical protein
MSSVEHRLSDVTEVVEPSGPDRECEEFVFIDLASVDPVSKRVVSPKRMLVSEAPARARQRVRSGDVLVSTVRPNLNGVASVSPLLAGAVASTGFVVLRARPELVDERYLFNWLCGPAFVAEMTRRATGDIVPAVSDAVVRSTSIPIPPLVEQRRIASVLDQADQLRHDRRDGIALLDEFAESLLLSMIEECLPSVDPPFSSLAETRPLDSSAASATAAATSPFFASVASFGFEPSSVRTPSLPVYESTVLMPAVPLPPYFALGVGQPPVLRAMKNLVASAAYGTSVKAGARGTVPVIRVSNITRQGDLSLTKTAAVDLPPAELERYAVAEGDVLLCRSSAHGSVVKAAIVREETTAVYAANVIRLRPENAKDAEYIAAFLTSAHAKLAVSEMATMNPANLLAMLMPLPSATVRATFAERIREIRLARTTQILQLARLNELHASLQHRGFSGRL